MRTLDEEIMYHKEKALNLSSIIAELIVEGCDTSKLIEEKNHHEQLVTLLEDYNRIKKWKDEVMEDFCRYDVNSFEKLVTNTRNKAIDDFKNGIKEILHDNAIYNMDCIYTLAEQLKK